jgi:RNase P subunit RPR2
MYNGLIILYDNRNESESCVKSVTFYSDVNINKYLVTKYNTFDSVEELMSGGNFDMDEHFTVKPSVDFNYRHYGCTKYYTDDIDKMIEDFAEDYDTEDNIFVFMNNKWMTPRFLPRYDCKIVDGYNTLSVKVNKKEKATILNGCDYILSKANEASKTLQEYETLDCNDIGVFKCFKCGFKVDYVYPYIDYEDADATFKFCPNCGKIVVKYDY